MTAGTSRSTNRRNGFVYTVFAIFILGLTFSLVVAQWGQEEVQEVGEKFRIDEVFYFLQSTTDDLDRASGIIGRRAVTSLTNHIVNSGDYIEDGPAAFREAFENGTVNGTTLPLMNQSTIRNWTDSMQEEAAASGYRLNLSLQNMDTTVHTGLQFRLNATYRLNLSDPVTRARFDKHRDVNTTFTYAGIEDPLILLESAGRYTNFFTKCSRDAPAIRYANGTDRFYQDDRNWTSGAAVVRENNGGVAGVADKGEKVAAVADLCSYTRNEIENEFTDFAGVISEKPAIDNTTGSTPGVCGYNDVDMQAIIDDGMNATNITAGAMAVMTEEQFWQNDIQNWTEQGCYVADPWGPSVWGRMEGSKSLQPDYTEGLAFFINIPDLPVELQEANESAVDYVYFNESGDFGTDKKVKGVTNEDFSWFRLDQDHAGYWNIEPLTYD